MSPTASWVLVTVVVGLPTLFVWALLRAASSVSRHEELLRESELQLGIALARSEQLQREHAFWAAPENQRVTIDLEECKDAADVRARLAGWSDRLFTDEPTHTVE